MISHLISYCKYDETSLQYEIIQIEQNPKVMKLPLEQSAQKISAQTIFFVYKKDSNKIFLNKFENKNF